MVELVRFFKVDGIWGSEGVVSRRRVKKFQLWRYVTILINWNFSFFEVINNFPYILWVTVYNNSFLPFLHRTWYLDFLSGWSLGRRNDYKTLQKHHKKADSPPPPSPVAQQIQFGNPPPLLDLINRQFINLLLMCSVLHSIAYPYLLITIYFF